MSDNYRLDFSFALPAYGPVEWPAVFEALARSSAPSSVHLQTMPAIVRDYLSDPSRLGIGAEEEQIGSPVELKRQQTGPEGPYHPKMPEWEVRFSVSMHDDEYDNIGYLLWMQMHALVGENGLYCVMFTENHRDAVTHFYKYDDDVIQIRMDSPTIPYWVPPEFPKTRAELSPSAQPPDWSMFVVAPPVVTSKEQRVQAVQAFEEMMADFE